MKRLNVSLLTIFFGIFIINMANAHNIPTPAGFPTKVTQTTENGYHVHKYGDPTGDGAYLFATRYIPENQEHLHNYPGTTAAYKHSHAIAGYNHEHAPQPPAQHSHGPSYPHEHDNYVQHTHQGSHDNHWDKSADLTPQNDGHNHPWPHHYDDDHTNVATIAGAQSPNEVNQSPPDPGGQNPGGSVPDSPNPSQPGGSPPSQPGGSPPSQPGGSPPSQPGGSPPSQPLPEDVDGDGDVDNDDLLAVSMNFGSTSADDLARYDLDGDGDIDTDDFTRVQSKLRSTVNSAPAASLALKLEQIKALNIDDPDFQQVIQLLERRLPEPPPKKTVLLANFPNPFNPETWIPYRLAKPADVTLTIYATNGQPVRTLALGHQPAGNYVDRAQAAYWDGKDAFGEPVASGLYFYSLTAGDFSATRKMLVAK